jgi:AcrR family transcriptional regulator
VSTLKKNEKNYHHGQLKASLIQIATDMLAEGGVETLSLREVAKRAGVSHNAPYQHFKDKDALVAAIVEEGFRKLGEAVDDAVDDLDEPQAKLIAAGQSYVSFMLEHPSYLSVMFSAFPHTIYPELSKTAIGTLERLIQIVVEGQARGVFVEGDAAEIAGAVWMMVHGLSSVTLAQKLPVMGERTPVELAGVYIRMLCQGVINHQSS